MKRTKCHGKSFSTDAINYSTEDGGYAGSIAANDSFLSKAIRKKYVHPRRRDTSKFRYLVKSSTFTVGVPRGACAFLSRKEQDSSR